jgi:CxxC motif-containing protein (DUF1111 family)
MRRPESTAAFHRRRSVRLSRLGAVIALGFYSTGCARTVDPEPSHEIVVSEAGLSVKGPELPSKGADLSARGAELFAREWLPEESKGPGGDGLGPVYNETSCIACHHQGGPGGAGPAGANVEILSIGPGTRGQAAAESHPGFRTSQSVVIHRFGVDPMYKAWRLRLLGKDRLADMVESVETEIQQVQQLIGPLPPLLEARGGFPTRNGIVLSRRNPPALFGAGLIDAVPVEALLDAEKARFPEFPEIKGRANHLKDGRVGRFGWKAETPDLREFVLSACANELGLEVPGHHQATSPLEPDAKAKGLDLTQEECDALVAYVRELPAPAGRKPAGSRESQAIADGRSLFESAGCATCHRARLGEVDGLYSDVLLHDMGRALSDSGSYYGSSEPDSPTNGVKRQEWRTPPLWGFRDSAPYLHDGRAGSLEEAVAFHGGQAEKSARRFFKLLPEERLRVQAFLRSLSPPAVAAR